MKNNIKVIDDFLPQEEFQIIETTLMETRWKSNVKSNVKEQKENIGWLYHPVIAKEDELENKKYFYLVHPIYVQPTFCSPVFEIIIPIIKKLNVKSLMRIKANLYPNSEKIYEHEEHIDYSWSHNAAILSINTCNGYTKLKDGTKIDSIANRMLLFDGSISHCSTTTSDQIARFNINFNYF